MSVFGVILFCIFLHWDWMRRDTPYISVFSLNAGRYGPEKLQIQTLLHSVWPSEKITSNIKYWNPREATKDLTENIILQNIIFQMNTNGILKSNKNMIYQQKRCIDVIRETVSSNWLVSCQSRNTIAYSNDGTAYA